MTDREATLLEENTRLKEERNHLKEQINEFERLNEGQQRTIQALQERIKGYIRRIYGRKSEKIDVTQMVFEDVILAAEKCLNPGKPAPHSDLVEEKVREHIRRKHPGRNPLPSELPRVEHYLDIPESEKFTADGEERPIIGVDISEKLDYRPAVMVVNRYIRPKYGADDDITGCGVKQHPPVDGPIDKCLAEPGLLAHIITEKYEHHTPLYRQEVKFERLGVDVSRQTMCGWMSSCAQALLPLYTRKKELILDHDIALNDDTPVQVLDPGSGKTHRGYIWCTVGGAGLKYTIYDFTMTRGREGPSEFFKGYQGHLMTDAYAGYNEVLGQDGIIPLNCWAHARRYFVEAQETHPKVANEILMLIARLYRIEQRVRTASADERLRVRRKESRPELARIMLWLRRNRRTFLPQTSITTAIAYTLRIRRNLTRYTRDGRLPIDNNLTENAIRPIALGRKNWLFAGSESGGQTAAILMTFCTTCRNLKINTWEYLTDVLRRINTHPMSKIDDLLPDRWQALRKARS